MIDAIAEIGDQLHLLAGLGDEPGINAIGDGRHEHVGGPHGLDEFFVGRGLVAHIEARIEQLAHAGFDDLGEPTCHHDERLLFRHLRVRLPDQIRYSRIRKRKFPIRRIFRRRRRAFGAPAPQDRLFSTPF